jgi:hypothetical protein
MGTKYHDKTTTEGGARGYKLVSSKWYKTADGENARVTTAREEMMNRLGRALKPNEIVHHKTPGNHSNGKDGELAITTRGENTAMSNRLRRGGKLEAMLKRMKKGNK